jgi:type II secretory pathway component PulM
MPAEEARWRGVQKRERRYVGGGGVENISILKSKLLGR